MTIQAREENGKLQVCIWAGPGEPDLNNPTSWVDFDEAEAQIAEFAEVAAGNENPFTAQGAARVWARWNAKGQRGSLK